MTRCRRQSGGVIHVLMWLVYLRYDHGGRPVTFHVTASTESEAQEVLDLASERGHVPGAILIEYAVFTSGAVIDARAVPDLHFFSAREFIPQLAHPGGGDAGAGAPDEEEGGEPDGDVEETEGAPADAEPRRGAPDQT
jgi:hypothetical protein